MEQVATAAIQKEEYLPLQTAEIILALSNEEVSTEEKIAVPVRAKEIPDPSTISSK